MGNIIQEAINTALKNERNELIEHLGFWITIPEPTLLNFREAMEKNEPVLIPANQRDLFKKMFEKSEMYSIKNFQLKQEFKDAIAEYEKQVGELNAF